MFVAETNPRKIIPLRSENISLTIHRDKKSKITSFTFGGFHDDISKKVPEFKNIDKSAKIVLEISNNQDFERFELGTVAAPDLKEQEQIVLDGGVTNLSYNFFIALNNEKVASNENFKPFDEGHGLNSGLISAEPSDLGEFAWRVYPLDGTAQPKIQFNNNPKLGMKELLQSPKGLMLIFPSLIEQILWMLPDANHQSLWVKNWFIFFNQEGIDLPDFSKDRKEDYQIWVDEVIEKLTKKWKLVSSFIDLEVSDDS